VLRAILAPNPSPLTLDGTRTYLIGRAPLVVVDPGPADPSHLEAVGAAAGAGAAAAILVTHDHPDHGAAADALGEVLRAPVLMAARGSLRDGQVVQTDAGEVVAVATPGHTPDHMALYWPREAAIFCGDLMMGGQDTALVAAPEGELGAYLASLERIRRLRPAVIHPAHGPSFERPAEALDRYVRHRTFRLEQVLSAIAAGAGDDDALLRAVYGPDLDPALQGPATAAIGAYLEHLATEGRVVRRERGWEAARS
jgi:glyoxylase-like metal-dependent hydrolase (beta-lactamase superfamily II)